MTTAPALAPTLVDQASQSLEDAWKPVNLIEDDESLFMLREVEFRLGQLCPVGRKLQVEVESLLPELFCQGVCERSFAHLPRPEQRHGTKLLQEPSQPRLIHAQNHTL